MLIGHPPLLLILAKTQYNKMSFNIVFNIKWTVKKKLKIKYKALNGAVLNGAHQLHSLHSGELHHITENGPTSTKM